MSDPILNGAISLAVLLLGAGVVGIFGMWGSLKSMAAKLESHVSLCDAIHQMLSDRLARLENAVVGQSWTKEERKYHND